MTFHTNVDTMSSGSITNSTPNATGARVVIVDDDPGVRELLTEDQDPETGSVLRFWCTREQVHKMARWGAEIAARGRPVCPQCGQPMEPEGHFCPKKNGHLH